MSVQRAVGPEPSQGPDEERAAFKRAAWKQGCCGVVLIAIAVWLVIKALPEWSTPDGEYSLWAAGPLLALPLASLGWGFLRDLVIVAEARRVHATRKVAPTITPLVLRTWRDAEFLAVHHMQQIGYSDARDTGGGSDGGIDAKATGAVAQVKMKSRPVGRPDVQRLVGAAGRGEPQDLLFYSLQGYTSQALEYANSQGVMLFQFDETGAIWAVNSAARKGKRPSS
ncbi:restriction endonuclease [Streptomyces sp. S.PB5]|uniref:restriction endonuclease n=1 Tax=Streptomyces sp. S.PB5 TaxID=3020844 RepID=UPI0025AEFD7E|nr:restriction endonuclease [Streptomyces sp. S.PB5]MDN3025680.1 restriction endonuclease [Streptomyces sp. S.PB5]